MKQNRDRKALTKVDCTAAVTAICLFTFLFFVALRGFNSIDESFYYTIPQRLLMGDRLLIEEWQVSQLSSVLQLLPYRLFTGLTGGTEGIILFSRFLFLFVDAVLFVYLYGTFRRYRWWGLLGVALFCGYVPLQIMALNYYTMSLHGLIMCGALLFFADEKKKAPLYILAGVVAACTVLAEPLLACLYFVWCVFVWCRTLAGRRGKELFPSYGFILQFKIWLMVSAGILLTFVVFCVFLLSRSPLSEIIKTVPELFTDSEYVSTRNGFWKNLDLHKLTKLTEYFGWPNVFCVLPLLFLALWNRKKKNERLKLYLFFAVDLVLVSSFVCFLIHVPKEGSWAVPIYYHYQSAPVIPAGLLFYLLCNKRDPRLFCLWCLGFLASCIIDMSSDQVMGFGGAILYPEFALAFGTLVGEIKTEAAARKAEIAGQSSPVLQRITAVPEKTKIIQNKEKAGNKKTKTGRRKSKTGQKKKRTALPKGSRTKTPISLYRICLLGAALAGIALTVWDAENLVLAYARPVVETVFNDSDDRTIRVRVQRGPLKGIATTARIAGIYEDILTDLDAIADQTDGALYVAGTCAYYYLYAGLPNAAYSAWYVENDSQTRQVRYWELHPEKQPAYIYIPYYDSYHYGSHLNIEARLTQAVKKLSFFAGICQFEKTEGKAGVILKVTRWL